MGKKFHLHILSQPKFEIRYLENSPVKSKALCFKAETLLCEAGLKPAMFLKRERLCSGNGYRLSKEVLKIQSCHLFTCLPVGVCPEKEIRNRKLRAPVIETGVEYYSCMMMLIKYFHSQPVSLVLMLCSLFLTSVQPTKCEYL